MQYVSLIFSIAALLGVLIADLQPRMKESRLIEEIARLREELRQTDLAVQAHEAELAVMRAKALTTAPASP